MIGMAQRNITSFFTTGRKSITTASSSSSHCLQDHMYHVAASSDRFDSESVCNTGTDSTICISSTVTVINDVTTIVPDSSSNSSIDRIVSEINPDDTANFIPEASNFMGKKSWIYYNSNI
jgi:hypothetical protein